MRRLALCVAVFAACSRPITPRHIKHVLPRIAILGDSVAHGAGDESGRGIGGARTRDVLRVLRTNAAKRAVAEADAIVLSIGGNDLYGDSLSRLRTVAWPSHAMARTLNRVAVVVDRIRAINPEGRIYVLGLFDPYRQRGLDRLIAQWDSRLISRFNADANIDVVRIADLFAYTSRLSAVDGFHPGAEGYAAIATRISSTW